jgi:murein DD-endopeptidase MepM/ murein hydrolase activator NlpD
MTRIRVDTDSLRAEGARLETIRSGISRLGTDIAQVAASMPSYDGQLSGPSHAAGMEAQSRSALFASRALAFSQKLISLADQFEKADQGPTDWWTQFSQWVSQEIGTVESLFSPHAEVTTPTDLLAATATPTPTAIPDSTATPTAIPVSTTPSATPTAIPTQPASYIIQPGDTLSSIAARFGLTVAALMYANPKILDPNQIAAGDTLALPGGTAATDPGAHPPRFPGIGDQISLSGLPFSADLFPAALQGFGKTLFALDPENLKKWYSHTSGMHNGLDFMVPYDTPLVWRGNTDATVVSINDPKNWGAGPNNIVLRSGNFYFLFGHTSQRPTDLHNGDIIHPDQPFGFTGNPDGQSGAGNDHLHLEVRPLENPGIAINPLGLFSGDLYKRLWAALQSDYPGGNNPESVEFYSMQNIS